MKRFLALLCVLGCLCALCVPAMAFGDITVKVKVPDSWNEVYLYMWDSLSEDDPKTSNAPWPGQKLSDPVDGWYEVQVPNVGFDHAIVSDGTDANKTKDIAVDPTWDLWITVDASLYYGVAYNEDDAGQVDFGPDSMAIVGAGIPGVEEWNPGAPEGDMTEVEDLIYEKTIGLAAGTKMTFKFAGNDSWDLPFNMGGNTAGEEIPLNQDFELVENGQDMAFTASEDMGLKVTLDLTAMADGGKATFKLEKVDGVEIPEPSAPVEATYFVAGESTLCGEDWNCAAEANKMVLGDDGLYTLTFANVAAGTYKLKVTDGTWDNCWGDPNSDDTDGNYLLTVEEAGNVTITFNAADKTISAAVTAGEPEVTEPSTEATEPSVEPSEPVTEPSASEPVASEPETSAPEASDPAASEPETSDPAESVPATTQPAEKEEEDTTTVQKALLILLGVLVVVVILAVILSIPKKIK